MDDAMMTTICRYITVWFGLGLLNLLGYLQDGAIAQSILYVDGGAIIGMLGVLGVHFAGNGASNGSTSTSNVTKTDTGVKTDGEKQAKADLVKDEKEEPEDDA